MLPSLPLRIPFRRCVLATIFEAINEITEINETFETGVAPSESGANGSHFRACAAGSAFPAPGAQIAAIAAAHDFAVASRGAAAFKPAGLVVVDPWTATTSS